MDIIVPLMIAVVLAVVFKVVAKQNKDKGGKGGGDNFPYGGFGDSGGDGGGCD